MIILEIHFLLFITINLLLIIVLEIYLSGCPPKLFLIISLNVWSFWLIVFTFELFNFYIINYFYFLFLLFLLPAKVEYFIFFSDLIFFLILLKPINFIFSLVFDVYICLRNLTCIFLFLFNNGSQLLKYLTWFIFYFLYVWHFNFLVHI